MDKERCIDCGKRQGRYRLAGRFAGLVLCSDCLERRFDYIEANPPLCVKCKKRRQQKHPNGRLNIFGYCARCDAQAERRALAKRDAMLAAGGMDISPTAR